MKNKDHKPTMDEMQDVLNVLSISAACKMWKKDQKTIQNAIDTGRIAAKQDHTGHWHISIMSMVAVYGAPEEAEQYDLAGKTYVVTSLK